MDVNTLLYIVIGSLVALVAAFYIKQGMAQAELNRAVELAQHKKNSRRMLNTLHGFPPQYLSPPFKLFLLEESIKELQLIINMEPDNKEIHRDLEASHELLAQHSNTVPPSQIRPVQTLDECNDIRTISQGLLKQVGEMAEQGRIEQKIAQQLNGHLQWLIAQVGVDFYLNKADLAEKDKKYPMALSLCHRVKQELSQYPFLDSNHSLQKKLDQKITELMKSTGNSDMQGNNLNPASLSEELDKLNAEENDKWTRKYF